MVWFYLFTTAVAYGIGLIVGLHNRNKDQEHLYYPYCQQSKASYAFGNSKKKNVMR